MRKTHKGLGLIILIWLIITLFFYQQHNITIKEVFIPGWKFETQDLQIKQIRLINKQRKKTQRDYKPSNLLFEFYSKTPTKLRPFVEQVITLYMPMYEKLEDNKWQIEISGAFIGDKEREIPQFIIQTDNGYTYTSGYSGMSNTASNLSFFTLKDKLGLNPYSKYFDIEYNSNDQKVRFRIYPDDFKTAYYNFFTKLPPEYQRINPEDTTSDMIFNYRDGKSIKDDFINANLKDKFIKENNWMKDKTVFSIFTPYASYYGKYKNFNDVFTATIVYEFDKKTESQDGQQIFYLIEDKEKWKIIDFGPLTNISIPLMNSFAKISNTSETELENMFLINSKLISLDESTKENVLFVGTPSGLMQENTKSLIAYYNPSYFVYKNPLKNRLEKLEIFFHTKSLGVDLFKENLNIKYADLDGDTIPEILFSYVIPYPEPTSWNPSILKLDKRTGEFRLFKIPDTYAIAKWDLEDVDKDGASELYVELNKDLSDPNEPFTRYLKLKDNNLIEVN